MSERNDDIKAAIERLKKKAQRRPPALWRRILPYMTEIKEARAAGVKLADLAEVFQVRQGALSKAIREAEEHLSNPNHAQEEQQ